MDYLTAIRSGKPVRRKGWTQEAYFVELCSNGLLHTSQYSDGKETKYHMFKGAVRLEHRFNVSDIMHDDWEFVEKLPVFERFEASGVSLEGEPLYRKVRS